MSKKLICMITGVGDGTGAYTARRFAKAGYHIAMLARDKNRLSNLENEIPNSKYLVEHLRTVFVGYGKCECGF